MPTCSELGTRKSLQKCLVAKTDIKSGEIFTESNIVAKRTGGEGISAFYVDSVLMKHAKRDFQADDIIEL